MSNLLHHHRLAFFKVCGILLPVIFVPCKSNIKSKKQIHQTKEEEKNDEKKSFVGHNGLDCHNDV